MILSGSSVYHHHQCLWPPVGHRAASSLYSCTKKINLLLVQVSRSHLFLCEQGDQFSWQKVWQLSWGLMQDACLLVRSQIPYHKLMRFLGTFINRTPPLSRHLPFGSKLLTSLESTPFDSWMLREEQTKEIVLHLLRMFIFAGYLSLDVVCYIWDQYIVSLKLPSFHCIATFSAAMLMLLREDILTCQNVRLKFASDSICYNLPFIIGRYFRTMFNVATVCILWLWY